MTPEPDKKLYPRMLPCGCIARRNRGEHFSVDVVRIDRGLLICKCNRRWFITISVTEVAVRKKAEIQRRAAAQ